MISVGIIVKNEVRKLPRAILSIMNQTYQDFELLIIDDFSNDGTKEYLEKINNPKIKCFFNKEWKGKGYNRNLLIKEFKYPYIAWQDADDISYPNRLKIFSSIIEKENPDIILGGIDIYQYDQLLQTYLPYFEKNNDAINLMFIQGNPLPFASSCFKKDLYDKIGPYVENGSYVDYFLEDTLIWTKWLKFAKISFTKEPVYRNNVDYQKIQKRKFVQNKYDIYNIVLLPMILDNYTLPEIFPNLDWTNPNTEKATKIMVNKIFIEKIGYKYFWRI